MAAFVKTKPTIRQTRKAKKAMAFTNDKVSKNTAFQTVFYDTEIELKNNTKTAVNTCIISLFYLPFRTLYVIFAK